MELIPQTRGSLKLKSGNQLPAVGLGTYRVINADKIFEIVDVALQAGYRLFDTAPVQKNLVQLARAFKILLPKYHLERSDIFITVKSCPSRQVGAEMIMKSFQNTLDTLEMDYIDLFLIQFPVLPKLPVDDLKNVQIQNNMWSTLRDLYDNGVVNDIGVFNSSVDQLKALLKSYHDVIPAVNQVEWNPLNHNNNLLAYCKENLITLQAHSSLGGTIADRLLNHQSLTKLSKVLGVSTSQILLAWTLDQKIGVTPASANSDHIRQNILLDFSLPPDAKNILDNLTLQSNCLIENTSKLRKH